MAWFSRPYAVGAPKPISDWDAPAFNYMPLSAIGWGSPANGGYVTPSAVPVWPLVTASRRSSIPLMSVPQNFPSPLAMFTRPRNIFGSG